MKIVCIPVSLVDENVYLYYDETSLEGVVIDPGSDADVIIKEIENKNVAIKGILLTHGHYDHISAVSELKNYSNANIYACKQEAVVLENPDFNLSSRALPESIRLKADVYLEDDDKIEFGNTSLTLIQTAGHTSGSSCFYSEENLVLFSGDTLFSGTVGRTDLPTSDTDTLLRSIREKLAVLPDGVTVYPGHGSHTTIAREKKYNPYFKK